MPSFSIALTGLQANSVALSTIGNNLANLNTTAYKKQTVNFADMFYQTISSNGSNSPLQVGLGARVASIASDFNQGNLTTTGTSSDIAINGSGFFVVRQGGSNQLTRSGDFQLSANGDLITSEGNNVMGYPVVDGAVDVNAPLEAMNVPTSRGQLAQPTSTFSFTTNLNSGAATGTQYTSSTSMYDSQGSEHSVSVVFTKTAQNSWDYAVTMPAGEATTTTGNTGTLTFNTDGSLATPTADVKGIHFAGLTDGASDMTLHWKLEDANGGSLISQSSAASSTNASSQDGYQSGIYKSFAVSSTGLMTATYTNGQTSALGQIAVATVTNPQALTRNGSSTYSVDVASGAMEIGLAGTGGRGILADSTLEQSNVDISTEFASLIVAQRSFEANSKTVTAFDTITQDTINMIR